MQTTYRTVNPDIARLIERFDSQISSGGSSNPFARYAKSDAAQELLRLKRAQLPIIAEHLTQLKCRESSPQGKTVLAIEAGWKCLLRDLARRLDIPLTLDINADIDQYILWAHRNAA